MNPPRASITQVTPEEIAQVEKILTFIDLRNGTLGTVSQWLLLWSEVRDLSIRYAQAPEAERANVSHVFKNLLERFIQVGKRIVFTVAKLDFPTEQIVQATGCDLDSFSACIEILNDKLIQWFDPSVSEKTVKAIWDKAA